MHRHAAIIRFTLKTKYVILLILFLISCTGTPGQKKDVKTLKAQKENQTELSFNSYICNLGVAEVKDKELIGYLEYTNETGNDMAFIGVSTNCRCVKVEYDSGIIHPGEKGRIKVIFINDQGPRKFEKKVLVRTSSLLGSIEFRIIGEIR